MRREFRAAYLALTFLTTLPLPHIYALEEGDFSRASAYYPLAGYLVGGLVALLLWLPLPVPDGVRSALALAAWLGLTGLLHFDGLVDSADALLVMKSPAERLHILKDVHVGAFGLATGVIYLLLLHSLLGAVPFYAPVVAAVMARALLLVPMNRYGAARAGSLGASARRGPVWVALLLALPALLLPQAWAAWLAAGLGMWLLAHWAARRLGGGLTGDIYGLLICGAELLALLALAWGH